MDNAEWHLWLFKYTIKLFFPCFLFRWASNFHIFGQSSSFSMTKSVSPRSWSWSKTRATVLDVLCARHGRFHGKYAGLPAQEAKALPPQTPQATSAKYIQRHWLLPSPLREAVSLYWCNGGCLLKVLSWLMQIFPSLVAGSLWAFSLLYSLAVNSFLPPPCFFSEPAIM